MNTAKILQTLIVTMMCLAGSVCWENNHQNLDIPQKFRTEFEQNIQNLLYVSSDGAKIFDSYGHVVKTINIKVRKSLFSENGWKEYQAYLNARQKKLKEAVKLATSSKTENGAIKKDTEKYFSAKNGEVIFEAGISISATSYDVVDLNLGKAFDLTVSFVSDSFDDPSKISITGWKAQFVEKGMNKK